MREIVRHFISKNHHRSYMNILMRLKNFILPYDLLKEQSKPLVGPTLRCLERAENEGTSIVIEGVNILPSLYNNFSKKKIYFVC